MLYVSVNCTYRAMGGTNIEVFTQAGTEHSHRNEDLSQPQGTVSYHLVPRDARLTLKTGSQFRLFERMIWKNILLKQ